MVGLHGFYMGMIWRRIIILLWHECLIWQGRTLRVRPTLWLHRGGLVYRLVQKDSKEGIQNYFLPL